MEAYYARATGQYLDLSEQQLMDCSSRWGNHGCGGGFLSQTYGYIYQNQGVTTEQNYAYNGRVNKRLIERQSLVFDRL